MQNRSLYLCYAIYLYNLNLNYLPTSAFSQIPIVPDSHGGANIINSRTRHSDNNNNKISSSEGTNSSSLNKVTNTSKPKLSILQVKATEVTANISQKALDKFGTKEMYPTKKGDREWYVNMADPKNDPIFSTGFSQTLIKKIAVPMTDVTIIIK